MTTATATPSRACHLRGCDHPACRDEHLRYCKEYDVRRHREGRRRIDATETAAHLRELLASGWTQVGIQIATGVPDHTICAIVNGIHTQVFRETAQTLLAFQPDQDTERPGYWTDPTGTVRRIRALASIGYPLHAIADAIDVPNTTLRHIAAGHRQKVAKDIARKIAAIYPRLITRPGRSQKARQLANARGWHGPMAWDHNIDDPAAVPDTDGEGATDLDRKRDALRTAEIEHLAGFQFSAHTIAQQVGLPVKDVEGRLARLRNQPKPVAA